MMAVIPSRTRIENPEEWENEMPNETPRLEELIRLHLDPLGGTFTNEFKLVARIEDGKVIAYIHPLNANGETLDYRVVGNILWPTQSQGSL